MGTRCRPASAFFISISTPLLILQNLGTHHDEKKLISICIVSSFFHPISLHYVRRNQPLHSNITITCISRISISPHAPPPLSCLSTRYTFHASFPRFGTETKKMTFIRFASCSFTISLARFPSSHLQRCRVFASVLPGAYSEPVSKTGLVHIPKFPTHLWWSLRPGDSYR
jgi:hypothetical protein